MLPNFSAVLAPPSLPLARGSADRAGVTRLQEWLVVRGYTVFLNPNNAPGIDGDFGGGTQAGVDAFAHDRGIPAIVNDAFWAALTAPMQAVSTYRPKATNLADAIVEVAAFYLEQKPREARQLVGGLLRGVDNSGPWPTAFCGWPAQWCQGMASAAVRRAATALGVALPFSLDGLTMGPLWVPDIAECANRAGRLVTGASGKPVAPGSMFFLKGYVNGEMSYSHVGIVTEWKGAKFRTAEGNTSGEGSTNGWLACEHERPAWTCDFGAV